MPKFSERVLTVELEALRYKPLLNIPEAAALTGVGQNKIDRMLKEPDCPFLLMNGTKKMLKKEAFISFLLSQSQI